MKFRRCLHMVWVVVMPLLEHLLMAIAVVYLLMVGMYLWFENPPLWQYISLAAVLGLMVILGRKYEPINAWLEKGFFAPQGARSLLVHSEIGDKIAGKMALVSWTGVGVFTLLVVWLVIYSIMTLVALAFGKVGLYMLLIVVLGWPLCFVSYLWFENWIVGRSTE